MSAAQQQQQQASPWPWPPNAIPFVPELTTNGPWSAVSPSHFQPSPMSSSNFQPSPIGSSSAGLNALHTWTPAVTFRPELSHVPEVSEPLSGDSVSEADEGFEIIDEKEASAESLIRHRRRRLTARRREPCGLVKGIRGFFQSPRSSNVGSTSTWLPPGFIPHARTAHGTPHPFPNGLPPSWPSVSPFPTPLAATAPPIAMSADWQGYRQWARSGTGGGIIINNPVHRSASSASSASSRVTSPSPSTVTVRLQPNSPSQTQPWFPGMPNPSAPARPPIWSTPDLSRPPVSSWACQLNPFLAHKHHGLAPIAFDVRRLPSLITFSSFTPGVIPLVDEHRAQPATFPLVPMLRIAEVADDPLGLPWPIVIQNPSGVTCEDVWTAIYETLQAPLGWAEYAALTERRKDQVKWSYAERTRTDMSAEAPAPGAEDGCRRIDLIGGRCMFRGLEPSSSGDGTAWTMFLGPP